MGRRDRAHDDGEVGCVGCQHGDQEQLGLKVLSAAVEDEAERAEPQGDQVRQELRLQFKDQEQR